MIWVGEFEDSEWNCNAHPEDAAASERPEGTRKGSEKLDSRSLRGDSDKVPIVGYVRLVNSVRIVRILSGGIFSVPPVLSSACISSYEHGTRRNRLFPTVFCLRLRDRPRECVAISLQRNVTRWKGYSYPGGNELLCTETLLLAIRK